MVWLAAFLFISLCGQAQDQGEEGAALLSGLVKEHPRLMLHDGDLARLKERFATDPLLRNYAEDVLARADKLVDAGPLIYEKIGPRLLHVSRACLDRVYALGLAWRWTGEEKYARATEKCLFTVCAFPDWNPSHFLDTAEMSHAVGVGYDWLYSWLSPEARETLRKGLIELGMKPGLAAYQGEGAWWVRSAFNWNQVCNSGLLAGALSIAETDPEYASVFLEKARGSLPIALATYDPDGAWGEGPGYWNYATTYTVVGLAMLQSALGTDLGLSRGEGLARSGFFPIYLTGPTGMFLNFADCGERSRRKTLAPLFWLARQYGEPFLAYEEHAMLREHKATPFHLIWYGPLPEKKEFSPPSLDRLFRGIIEVAVFRSAWDDPEALFVGVKAGYNQVNHGHLDLGSFELDALGERWARDLGRDDYNLPGYWDRHKGGKRWTYYRMCSVSHNVPLLDGVDQDPLGTSRITAYESREEIGFAVVDFTKAYASRAKSAHRGVALLRDRHAVLVQDEFDLKAACEVAFGMTTDGAIDISESGKAVLSLNGKKLEAHILAPAGAAFTKESAEQKAPQKRNKGIQRLMVRLAKQEGFVRVAVLFTPLGDDAAVADYPEVIPLTEW